MKCDFCNEEVKSVHIGPVGAYCEGCEPVAAQRWYDYKAGELAKAIDDFPAEMDLEAFESFAARLAIHAMEQKEFAKAARRGCMGHVDVALMFKDELIRAMPAYFSTWEARGHERMFHGGTYRVIGTVPLVKALEACRKVGILTAA